jgi:hypothetical protein
VNAAFDAALVDRHAAGHHTSLAEDNNGSVLVPDQQTRKRFVVTVIT